MQGQAFGAADPDSMKISPLIEGPTVANSTTSNRGTNFTLSEPGRPLLALAEFGSGIEAEAWSMICQLRALHIRVLFACNAMMGRQAALQSDRINELMTLGATL